MQISKKKLKILVEYLGEVELRLLSLSGALSGRGLNKFDVKRLRDRQDELLKEVTG